MWNVIKGSVSFCGYVVNTLFWCIPIFLLSFFKLIPIPQWQKGITYLLDGCASRWVAINNINQKITGGTRWQIQGVEQLSMQDWYLVIANHRSWVDILVLQRLFHRKIPFLKFFLKKELIWVPFLGLAWWALDFPFMRRYSKAFLAKHPHLKGKDLETTRKACEKFRFKPVSIMNFVEGTRFTEIKHKAQSSQFKHLLTPKAGGVAFVLGAMGQQLHKLLDVTIHYPDGTPSFWDFISGKVKEVRVSVQVLNLDELMQGDYFNDPAHRQKFQQWLNLLWLSKDQTLDQFATGK